MALAFQHQIRNLYLLGAKVAEEANLKKEGDFCIVTTPRGVMVQVMQKNGIVVSTKMIDTNKINSTALSYPVVRVGPSIEYSFEKDPANFVGQTVVFTLKVHEGTNEDIFMNIVAGREIQVGDTKAIIMTDIAQQLAYALGNDALTSAGGGKPQVDVGGKSFTPNMFFDIKVTGDKFTVTEKNWVPEHYTLTLKFQEIMWRLTGRMHNEIINGTTIKAVVVNEDKLTQAFNQGYQMLAMEDYLIRNRAEIDTFAGGYNIHREHQFDIKKEYTLLDVSFYEVSRNDPHHSDQIVTFAVEGKVPGGLSDILTALKDTTTSNNTVVNAPAEAKSAKVEDETVEDEDPKETK